MPEKKSHDAAETNGKPTAGPTETTYVFRLFIAGMLPLSIRAIENVKKICEEHLRESYKLEVIDVYQQHELAVIEQIIAVPTLIRKLPLPSRRVIGDMSKTERVLAVIDLKRIE